VLLVSAPVAFSQVWLAPRLPPFLQANPDVDVRLTLMDRPVDLIEEGIDLGIRIARDLAPGLAARKLMEMRYVLVASPAYLAAQGAPERPHDLLRHDCIYLGHAEFGQRWTLRCAVETCTVDVRARLSINNSSAILAAVEAGGGVGLIPEFTAQPALQDGRVLQLLPEWDLCDPYRGAIYAVYTPGRHIAPKIRAFIDYLAAAV
jgi:DNA-binding transcriptional LysR family regulator